MTDRKLEKHDFVLRRPDEGDDMWQVAWKKTEYVDMDFVFFHADRGGNPSMQDMVSAIAEEGRKGDRQALLATNWTLDPAPLTDDEVKRLEE